jgi:multimeric flavodoxin WrbA
MNLVLEQELLKIREIMLSEENVRKHGLEKLDETIKALQKKEKVLLLSCSNRYNWDENKIDIPKSRILAEYIAKELGDKAKFIDVTELKIHPCEGNVSRKEGNSCGIAKAELKDKKKNPTGNHRCWASINFKYDELWKISKELFESDCVIFFSSVRWGSANMFYQNLIERLTWIQNRHTTLGEKNVVKGIESGMISVGQNFNGEGVIELQKEIHRFYGFDINNKLYWNWQYTESVNDESQKSYKDAFGAFVKDFDIKDFTDEIES